MATSITSANERLLGKWKSSLGLSKNFYQQHTILRPVQLEFIEQLFGNLEIEYKPGIATTRSRSKKIIINGEQHDFTGSNYEAPYEILFESDNKIVIKSLINGCWEASTLVFVNDNVYWVYPDDGEFGSDLNIREYFVRVK